MKALLITLGAVIVLAIVGAVGWLTFSIAVSALSLQGLAYAFVPWFDDTDGLFLPVTGLIFDWALLSQVAIAVTMVRDYFDAEWAHESPLRAYATAYASLVHRTVRFGRHVYKGLAHRRFVERPRRIAAAQAGPGATTRDLHAVKDNAA